MMLCNNCDIKTAMRVLKHVKTRECFFFFFVSHSSFDGNSRAANVSVVMLSFSIFFSWVDVKLSFSLCCNW